MCVCIGMCIYLVGGEIEGRESRTENTLCRQLIKSIATEVENTQFHQFPHEAARETRQPVLLEIETLEAAQSLAHHFPSLPVLSPSLSHLPHHLLQPRQRV